MTDNANHQPVNVNNNVNLNSTPAELRETLTAILRPTLPGNAEGHRKRQISQIIALFEAELAKTLERAIPEKYRMTRTFDQAQDSYDDARGFGQAEGYNQAIDDIKAVLKDGAKG